MQVVFIVIAVLNLALHAHCQPYRSNFSNVSETFLLISIAILAVLQTNKSKESSITAAVVFFVTFLYICGVTLMTLVKFIRKKLRGRPFENEADEGKQRPTTPAGIRNLAVVS